MSDGYDQLVNTGGERERVSDHLPDFEKSLLARRLRTDIEKLRQQLAKKDKQLVNQVSYIYKIKYIYNT